LYDKIEDAHDKKMDSIKDDVDEVKNLIKAIA
jgi:hypothetical protein